MFIQMGSVMYENTYLTFSINLVNLFLHLFHFNLSIKIQNKMESFQLEYVEVAMVRLL